MPYPLPTFNLNVKIWRRTTWVASYPPTVPTADVTAMGNLAIGRRTSSLGWGYMFLLLPKLTDIRDGRKEDVAPPSSDIVEVPAGSGRYYQVDVVDDAGKGFTNEHRVATLVDPPSGVCPAWPVPYP